MWLLHQSTLLASSLDTYHHGSLWDINSCRSLMLVLPTPPFTSTVLDDAIDQTVFTDLGFGECIKLLHPSMAAYHYLHHPYSTGYTNKKIAAENGTTTNVLAPFSLDGTQCCCVVDSGFLFTHVRLLMWFPLSIPKPS
jgi:hypothetical protein